MQKRNKVLAGVLTGALVLSAGPMALAATAKGIGVLRRRTS